MKFTCEKYLLSLAVATAGRAAAKGARVSARALLAARRNGGSQPPTAALR